MSQALLSSSRFLFRKPSAMQMFTKTALSSRTICDGLKAAVEEQIPKRVELLKYIKKNHGSDVVGEITVDSVIGGMRGLKSMVWDASLLDPNEGIRFYGKSIADCQEVLPASEGPHGQMLPESMLWFLLTNTVPTEAQVSQLCADLAANGELPQYLHDIIEGLPVDMHPMTQLSIAVAALNKDSKFAKAYADGLNKTKYWEYVFEDSMQLIAKLPMIAAKLYQKVYHGTNLLANTIDPKADISLNFARMIGMDQKPGFVDIFRLYTALHADHEGGNVSAHAVHLIGSTLSDPYLSYSAGLLGLAGPLHGLAAQEALRFILKMKASIPENFTDADIEKFLEDTLASGQVIPGYGHAVLRKPDPRFDALMKFASETPDVASDPLWQLVNRTSQIAPQILIKHGKAKNPYPNVDSSSGVLFHHYGINQTPFYTVTFGISRSIGPLTQLIWDRIYGLPIERPKSLTLEVLAGKPKSKL